MHPEKLLPPVHHADEAAKAGILRFEQGVQFAQGCAAKDAKQACRHFVPFTLCRDIRGGHARLRMRESPVARGTIPE